MQSPDGPWHRVAFVALEKLHVLQEIELRMRQEVAFPKMLCKKTAAICKSCKADDFDLG
jgi:hypothetical protein